MSDIIKALRRYKEPVPHEAADRIEALEAALRKIIKATGNSGRTAEIAKGALEQEQDK